MSYEFQKQDVFDFAATIPTEKHEKGNELFFRECPYCHGGRHHDTDTFSVNLETGLFKCFRAGCGAEGHFVELARDFNFPLDFGDEKYYRILPQKEITTKPEAIRYLEGRGISEATARKYKITVQTAHRNILVFPFIDENGVMQFVKYRKTDFNPQVDKNKEWSEKDTKPILFGMAQCEPMGTLIITEGQLDSLSVAECGIPNAVSVPNGARGFTWVQHCTAFLERFEEIIVFGDNEHGRITLADDLQARTKRKIKVVRVKDYLGLKDANDILRTYGKQAIVKAIQNAEVPEIKNIKKLSKVKAVDLLGLPKIRTGIYPLDKAIGGIFYGQVVLLSGKRGEGKSTLMSQLIAEALDQDERVFIYSGELPDYHCKHWLDLQLAGKANLQETEDAFGEKKYRIPTAVQERIDRWYDEKAFLYDNTFIPDDGGQNEGLLQTVERAILQYDVRLVCIDNLMTAMEGNQNDLYHAQSEFVGRLKQLAMKYNVAVILVAHPKKKKEGGFENDDVSGSSDITNKVDVVMAYERTTVDDLGEGAGRLSLSKNRLTGKLLMGQRAITMAYHPVCKRIVSIEKGDMQKVYGWEEKTAPEGFQSLQDDADCPF